MVRCEKKLAIVHRGERSGKTEVQPGEMAPLEDSF